MRRALWMSLTACLLAGCHAHQVASDRETLAKPGAGKTVSSSTGKPVGTTPGALLDPSAMKKIQAKLHVSETGQLDDKTQAALRRFQKQQGQPDTGLPDYDTLRRLGLDPHSIYTSKR